MYIGGLDIGSSGCKITVCDNRGNLIESHYQPYDMTHTSEYHEIDTRAILKGVESVITQTESPLAALGVTSFGETFALMDENDSILCESMIYSDPRGEEECALFDKAQTAAIAGCVPNALYSLPKLMWIKKHRPEIFSKVKKVLLMADLVVYQLCGARMISYTAATRTMGFDIRKKGWSRELFDIAGIDPALMSEPVPEGTLAGISNKFGLKDTKIIVGCHDQTAAAIGAGALSAGEAIDGTGSVECLTPIFDSLPDDNAAQLAGIAYLPYVGGMYSGCAFSFTGGTALKWFRHTFAPTETYSALDASISRTPSGILVMPHFTGAATPYMDSRSTAMFSGITLATTKYDLCRAIMEGVVYEMKINLDLLAANGIRPKRLLATGGCSTSAVWNQMKADITGLPITIVDTPEVGALGTIMCAAVTVGAAGSLADAAEIYSKKGPTFEPDPAAMQEYAALYERYRRMYELSLQLR